jgi:small subunit ribosomal protein S21
LAEVHIQDGETLESALRRFKRKVQQEDIIKEIKRHSYYLKPGEKRRVKDALARKRNRKRRPREIEEPYFCFEQEPWPARRRLRPLPTNSSEHASSDARPA